MYDDPAIIDAATQEFQKCFEYSLRLREEHGGNVRAAFLDFTGEPDIVWHWGELGVDVRAHLLVNAASMIAQMTNALGGKGIRGLPREIVTRHTEEIREAGYLVFLYGTTESALIREALRISEEMPRDYQVRIFVALLMSAFAPAPTERT